MLSKSLCKLIKLQNRTAPCFPVYYASQRLKRLRRQCVESHSISVSGCMKAVAVFTSFLYRVLSESLAVVMHVMLSHLWYILAV